MKILSWNVREIPLHRIGLPEFDIAVLTELEDCGLSEFSVQVGGRAYSAFTGGSVQIGGRAKTKVAILTRLPAEKTSVPYGFHEGRIVEATIAGTTVVGVCIPWKGAYRQTPWNAYTEFCGSLKPYLAKCSRPAIVAGDFNSSPTARPRSKHMKAFSSAFEALPVATANLRKRNGRPLIDHIATDMEVRNMELIGDDSDNPSDHVGAMIEINC